MELFFYYALHSLKNQIRKLFRTWVVIFFAVIFFAGLLIGFIGAWISDIDAERHMEQMLEDSGGYADDFYDYDDYYDYADGYSDYDDYYDYADDSYDYYDDDYYTDDYDADFGDDRDDYTGYDADYDEYSGDWDDDFYTNGSNDWDDYEDYAYDEDSPPVWLLDTIETVTGVLILLAFIFTAFLSDRSGSKIFLPADVNLLFPSPIRPQSALMFRLMTQAGTILIASVYLLFQLPNLVLNLGMSVWSASALMFAWCLLFLLCKFIQVFLYTFTASRPGRKKWLRRGLYAFILLLSAGLLLFFRAGDDDFLTAANRFFNYPGTQWIPFWGWLKAFCRCAIEGNVQGTLGFLALITAGSVALAFAIRNMKADFYEDAMAQSEQVAELLEQAQSKQSGGIVFLRRQKSRSDKLRRDMMRHGSGANVYFFKTFYNRFRFARFGILTKTLETYFIVSLALTLFLRFVLEIYELSPVLILLGVLVFFRTLGNPLEEDTRLSFFVLMPENLRAKLLWSLLGGLMNSALDLLPSVILAAILLDGSIPEALSGLAVILSLDFYATCAGTFIHTSVPVSAGNTLKRVVLILFLYFGLLPDIALLSLGTALDWGMLSSLAAIVCNVATGYLFFLLSAHFLDPSASEMVPSEYRPPAAENTCTVEQNQIIAEQDESCLNQKEILRDLSKWNLRVAKRCFSRLGTGACVILLASSVAQAVLIFPFSRLWPTWTEDVPWLFWLMTFVPMYAIGVPAGLRVMQTVPASRPVQHRLGVENFLTAAAVSVFMMYAGNLIGILFTTILQTVFRIQAENPIEAFAQDSSMFFKIVFLVILGPLMEELIFRHFLIDRMRIYGEKTAVITSALMFGLFHGNLSQMFYASTLGLVFGFVYLKTGRLRYSAALHMMINLIGGILAPSLLEYSDMPDALTDTAAAGELLKTGLSAGTVALLLYSFVMIALFVIGFILLIVRRKDIRFTPQRWDLPEGMRFRTVCFNAGMLVLFIMCMGSVVLTFFA